MLHFSGLLDQHNFGPLHLHNAESSFSGHSDVRQLLLRLRMGLGAILFVSDGNLQQ